MVNNYLDTLSTSSGDLSYYSLERLQEKQGLSLEKMPVSIRIILENILRNVDGKVITQDDVDTVSKWRPDSIPEKEVPFMPARVLLQDFTGVPVFVDLASMRSAVKRMGGDPSRINPLVPVDLVIDHSVQVDFFGNAQAMTLNLQREFERNQERYALLRWAQQAFENTRVLPPGVGIVHQVNLEYLADVVSTKELPDGVVAFPDTLVGTDSHTTMVNGLGVLGWGVGGIEAEAVMVGQPYYMLLPEVIGFELSGELSEGVTATDLVLTVTEMLRKKGVVAKIVEFYGKGLSSLSLPDRATISNMAPEYGATAAIFPVDDETIAYLVGTGRDPDKVELVKSYYKAQGMFRTDDTPSPEFTDFLALDLAAVESSLAGPKRPQDRVALGDMKKSFQLSLEEVYDKPKPKAETTSNGKDGVGGYDVELDDGEQVKLEDGVVVISAITSCTNTSNPSVMVGAGLLAKKATDLGLDSRPWVKTSMAPGSKVVTEYLNSAGLTGYLEKLGFYTVGYGCTTCIGNSGPLPEPVAEAIVEHDIVSAAVLSGNRNFEARVHPQVKANYLASPMLVLAYAIAGTVDIDLSTEPIGQTPGGEDVYLKDIWPSQDEIRTTINDCLNPEMYRDQYSEAMKGEDQWVNLPVPEGELYQWDEASTYIQELPIFHELPVDPDPLEDISGAKVLAVLGDSITTDHISPAGSIALQSPAGRFLTDNNVTQRDFNTYGARRGNHEVLMRGTFANVRLRNLMVPDTEGGVTVHLPDMEQMSIFDASAKYIDEGVSLVIFAGKEYGSGSSRDWAAKGPFLMGVKAVIAESYERIHRSNLIGMGVLPLQFLDGENRDSIGLDGFETYKISGIAEGLLPGKIVDVAATNQDGGETHFQVKVRIDTPIEVEYLEHGGVLQYVLRQILKSS